MSKTQLQVRVDEEVKRQATELYDKLGLNVSDAINLFLRQSIYAKGIPFEIKIPSTPIETEGGYRSDYSRVSYSPNEVMTEVKATMAIEDMHLTQEDEKQLSALQSGKISADDLRKMIFEKYSENGTQL